MSNNDDLINHESGNIKCWLNFQRLSNANFMHKPCKVYFEDSWIMPSTDIDLTGIDTNESIFVGCCWPAIKGSSPD